jgi:predicted ester cyclase
MAAPARPASRRLVSNTNKDLVRRFYQDVFVRGELDLLDVIAPDLHGHGTLPPGLPERGSAPYKRTVEMFRAAFPDLAYQIPIVIGEGDVVAARVVMLGTHRGSFLGIRPTNRRVQYAGMDFFRCLDGRLVEHWALSDDLGLLQTLGAIPTDQRWSRPAPPNAML